MGETFLEHLSVRYMEAVPTSFPPKVRAGRRWQLKPPPTLGKALGETISRRGLQDNETNEMAGDAPN